MPIEDPARYRRGVPGGTLFVAIALGDEEQRLKATRRLAEAAFTEVEPNRMVYGMFADEARRSGRILPDKYQVWMRKSDEDASYALDRVLRDVRRETRKQMFSMEMTCPDARNRDYSLKTLEQQLEDAKAMAVPNPGNASLQRAVISDALVRGRLAEARQLVTSLRLACPDDFDTLAAQAFVSLTEGRIDEATRLLERVRTARPRDHHVGIALLAAYEAAGCKEYARKVRRELQAHGISLP